MQNWKLRLYISENSIGIMCRVQMVLLRSRLLCLQLIIWHDLRKTTAGVLKTNPNPVSLVRVERDDCILAQPHTQGQDKLLCLRYMEGLHWEKQWNTQHQSLHKRDRSHMSVSCTSSVACLEKKNSCLHEDVKYNGSQSGKCWPLLKLTRALLLAWGVRSFSLD